MGMQKQVYCLVVSLFIFGQHLSASECESGTSGRSIVGSSPDTVNFRPGARRVQHADFFKMRQTTKQLTLKSQIEKYKLKQARVYLEIERIKQGQLSPASPTTMHSCLDAGIGAGAGRINLARETASICSERSETLGHKLIGATGVTPRVTFGVGLLAGATLVCGAAYLKGGPEAFQNLFKKS